MKRTAFDDKNVQPTGPSPDTRASLRCSAYGCRLFASVRVEGGQWLCSAHSMALPDHWQDITAKLHQHDWLVAFIGDLQRMDRQHQDWRDAANRFWQDVEPRCCPADGENAVPYQNRMRYELLWRCGAVATCPQVRLPRVSESVGDCREAA